MDMLQKPTEGENVYFDDWSILGVEAVLIGKLTQSQKPNTFIFQFQLFDTFKRKQLIGFRMTVNSKNYRAAGHRAADIIYEELTGIKGIFSTKIAYITAHKENDNLIYSLIVSDQDGENDFKIVESKHPIMSPAWSPDSRQLAYVSFEDSKSSIFIQTLRSGNRFKISDEMGINGAPSFSPDGSKLVITLGGVRGNLDIYTLNVASKQLNRLTTHRGIDTEGAWSQDGKYIYFTSDRSGSPQIYRIPSVGGSPERITYEGKYNARPRLSPDSSKLAMVHNDRGNYRIAVMNLKKKDLLILSSGSQDESPSFSPNSDILIYATRHKNLGVLETVSADGSIRQKIASGHGGDVREPVWSPFPNF
tara:strand:- start:4277 stop:5362 length:1086 start_codon:yes stop_codon:yes gene_type:complete